MNKKIQVVYDDRCPTCTVGKNAVERLDRTQAIEFVGMNTENGKHIVEAHKLDMRRSAYVIKDGTLHERAEMVREVLSHGGITGMLLSLPFRIPWLGNKLYDLLAMHRRFVTTSKID